MCRPNVQASRSGRKWGFLFRGPLEINAHKMPGMQSEAAARFAELVAGGA
jgi:hypothetical protein